MTPDADRFDAAIVLGHTADPAHPVLRARVDRGCSLYRDGAVDCLVMSGHCSFAAKVQPPRAEAHVMRDLAIASGIPATDVLIEDESTDTLGNAWFAAERYIVRLRWRHIAVVSTDTHLERSAWLFRKVLGPGYVVTPVGYDGRMHWNAEQHAESVARNAAFLDAHRRAFDHVVDGDRAALAAFLRDAPPTASTAG